MDPAARTFVASHHYADDEPTGTATDELTIRVEVTDDDGDQNPPNVQFVEVETNRTGAIELPTFQSSLPSGQSGLLQSAHVTVESAHVTVEPEQAVTTVAAARTFNPAPDRLSDDHGRRTPDDRESLQFPGNRDHWRSNAVGRIVTHSI